MRTRLTVSAVLVAALGAGDLSLARAAEGGDGLRADLWSTDEPRSLAAARQLAKQTDARSTEVVLDALTTGVGPKVAVVLLESLASRGTAKAQLVLEDYARHRTVEVRRVALAALGQQAGDKGVRFLVRGLSDPSPEIRNASAEALGKRKERSAEGPLLRLLEKGEAAAANALGELATPELAHRIAEKLGHIPDPVLCQALGEMLKRPDFGPDKIRSELVKTLAKIPSIESTVALQEYVAASVKDTTRPSRIEAEKIVEQRSK